MCAGLTSNGLVIKRLDQIISDREDSARNYFGNDIGTSVNDVLGRALRIHSDSENDLWQLLEAIKNSFSPSYATGNQLDEIVAYAGITRFGATKSTVSLLVTGDFNTFIPTESIVSSTATQNRFYTTSGVNLNNTGINGFTTEVLIVTVGADYTITIGSEDFTYTAQSGDTLSNIASALQVLINSSSEYSATVVGDESVQVQIQFNDKFVVRNASLSSNLSFIKVSKLVPAEAQEFGPITQPAGTLTTIASPRSGWDSVTNPVSANEGQYRETDEELRVRFKNAKEANAKGTIDAIFSNLSNLQGVDDVQVYENDTESTDANGLPPKSFSVVILGGNSQTIAETIWEVKPAGIATYGNTTVTISDTQGIPHDINFSRPEEVDIYIDVTISQAENQSVPANVETQILDALEQYFEDNFSVGDDVIYSRLYVPIQSIEGFQIDSLTIGTSASPSGASNIVIDFDQVASLQRSNVTVTVS